MVERFVRCYDRKLKERIVFHTIILIGYGGPNVVYRGSFLAASGKSNVRVDLSIAAKATVLTFPEFQHSGTFSCKCVSLSFTITYTKVQRVMRFRPFPFRLSTSRCPRAFLSSCSKVSSSYLCYLSYSFQRVIRS